jgi:hypothetical protein
LTTFTFISINVQRQYIKIRDVVCRQTIMADDYVIRNACTFPPIPLMHTVNRGLTDNWVMDDKSFNVLVNKPIIMK